MAVTLTTKMRIASWDESPVEEFDDGSKLTHAQVRLSDGEQGLASGLAGMLAYYRPDGTSSFVTVMRLTGILDGRAGSFVLRGEGTFDGTTASGRMTVVTGSGTGGLAGITGTCESVSTHADYPFMPLTLAYELA
ncbi:MAG TPA: DUF3224 domain-containing protein [Streptosporangiaceae bacterium]|nr:DUF3224 domain-containing protein [Streptosporangiaceae bacterium]